ncbi:hypothetical protein [Brunnivagina elsteri]|jgi:hypothetical protein|uniref:Uncharacterized protein n=1 Tax=Brunnivagina elsteri CCALA 953 TaxID=987040 RepID=A0A2A2TM22_9CYAN|nr:hypothetical protein [Calothrix elsteri]PAX59470.1 hypothetical protein CK510_06920 [Calothrix elsteri CCALA 953]
MAQEMNTSHLEQNIEQTYKKRLNSWAIARLLPDMKREIVARFRSRSDADGHLQLLLRVTPEAKLMLVFDCQQEEVVA